MIDKTRSLKFLATAVFIGVSAEVLSYSHFKEPREFTVPQLDLTGG